VVAGRWDIASLPASRAGVWLSCPTRVDRVVSHQVVARRHAGAEPPSPRCAPVAIGPHDSEHAGPGRSVPGPFVPVAESCAGSARALAVTVCRLLLAARALGMVGSPRPISPGPKQRPGSTPTPTRGRPSGCGGLLNPARPGPWIWTNAIPIVWGGPPRRGNRGDGSAGSGNIAVGQLARSVVAGFIGGRVRGSGGSDRRHLRAGSADHERGQSRRRRLDDYERRRDRICDDCGLSGRCLVDETHHDS